MDHYGIVLVSFEHSIMLHQGCKRFLPPNDPNMWHGPPTAQGDVSIFGRRRPAWQTSVPAPYMYVLQASLRTGMSRS